MGTIMARGGRSVTSIWPCTKRLWLGSITAGTAMVSDWCWTRHAKSGIDRGGMVDVEKEKRANGMNTWRIIPYAIRAVCPY